MPLIERALRQKTSYRNTFLHRAPVLDICAPGEADVASCDVLVCSDVLEHVTPPVARAFHGMMRILRPGGHVLLTVPCTASEATTEHYPNLFDYRIVERNGKTTLVNRTRDGHVEEFQDLVFHGGPGETLEMRHFAMNDLEKQLLDAGFSEVQIFAQADFRHGVYWAAPYPVPVVAQAGRQRGRQSVRHTATTNGLPSGNR